MRHVLRGAAAPRAGGVLRVARVEAPLLRPRGAREDARQEASLLESAAPLQAAQAAPGDCPVDAAFEAGR
eukprot:3240276-Lingulodinium_polyedra.AAC.1